MPVVVTSTTIDYTYDPLYRLTAADYDSGEFFHFTYDAIGNRLTQDTHLTNNVYTYDDANRLTSVDDVPYTWDANGNLLDDGLRTYAYDHAGRLSSVVLGADTYVFNYNGLGDRLQQIVNGVASDYTLDIETGLTQVLSDSEQSFLYGVGRVAQQGIGGREYFLGDALRSARQLVNSAGETRLGRAYEPFGDLLSIAGELQTSYGFTGEWADDTGLIHLRARYYQPADGRFTQPDPFEGIPTRPISQNPYPYAYDNPLMYTDASGQNPIVALAGGIAGGIVLGAAAGGLFGHLTYDWALAGECGCKMQQRAMSMSYWDWIGANALAGGILGGAAVAISAVVGFIGPAALIAVSGLGLYVSVKDFIKTAEIILYETGGLTTCTAIRLLMDVTGIVLSTVGIVQGIRAWRVSGSLLSWAPVKTLPGRWGPRRGPYTEYEEWVRTVNENPPDRNLYVYNGKREVAFDARGKSNGALIDAKSSKGGGKSYYDKVFENWAQESVLTEAYDQIAAGSFAGEQVEWWVDDQGTATILADFFRSVGIKEINVKWVAHKP